MGTKIRLLYLSFFAAGGSLAPYIAPYLHSKGFSDGLIGTLFGIGAISYIISPLLLGALADAKYGALRIFRYCTFLCTLGIIWFSVSDSRLALWLSFILMVFTRMSGFGLLDGICFEEIEAKKTLGLTSPRYESLRLWGSFGYALTNIGIFFVLDALKGNSLLALYIAAALMFLSYTLTFASTVNSLPKKGKSILELLREPALRRLIRTRPLSTFLIVYALLMVSASVFDSFHGRYFQDLGVAEKFLGPIWGVAVLVEIVFVWALSSRLASLGVKTIVCAGALAMLVRHLMYAGGGSIISLLIAQLAHGPVALALYFMPQMFLDSRIPAQYRNSLQGFMRGACIGLPMLIGPFVGGWLADYVAPDEVVGLQASFWFASGVALLAFLWFFLGFKETKLHASKA